MVKWVEMVERETSKPQRGRLGVRSQADMSGMDFLPLTESVLSEKCKF